MASGGGGDKPPAANPDTAPDPDEDDLDDLDEMLDEFAATNISAQPTRPPAPGASGPGRPPTAPAPAAASDEPGPPPEDAEDFAAQLQAGMAQMLQDLESNPEMAKQFEEMMAGFGDPPPAGTQSKAAGASSEQPTTTAAAAAAASKTSEDAFQDTIRRTMDRMKASSSSADAAAASAPSPFDDDMMASLLRELQSSTDGEDGDGDESFSKMLLGMMEQLTNKDILYEPMKELDSKFPGWLQEKGDSLPQADKDRYQTQQGLVREIVQRFERDGYKDENPDDREFIVERMQQMQAAGAPPPDLVGDVDSANEMVAGLDQGCAPQ